MDECGCEVCLQQSFYQGMKKKKPLSSFALLSKPHAEEIYIDITHKTPHAPLI